MTYSPETIARVEKALRSASAAFTELADALTETTSAIQVFDRVTHDGFKGNRELVQGTVKDIDPSRRNADVLWNDGSRGWTPIANLERV